MLVAYFLRRFFFQATIYLAILTALFLACNVVTKLPVIYDFWVIPVLLWFMMPVVALFALPLAASMALFSVIAAHKIHDELLVTVFLPRARRSLVAAGLVFALVTALGYGFVSFIAAPRGYALGKKLLINAARDHLVHLPPNIFHSPLPMVSFFVRDKQLSSDGNVLFNHLMLVISTKQGERMLFTASRGSFVQRQLQLEQGRVVMLKGTQVHSAAFEKTQVDVDALFAKEDPLKGLNQAKLFNVQTLLAVYANNNEAFVELHKRIAQSLWQLLLCALALFMALITTGSSLLSSVGVSGILFLISYVLVAAAQAFVGQPIYALLLLYVPLLGALLLAGVCARAAFMNR